MYILEVDVNIDAQLVTAFFTGVVAILVAYGTLQQRKVASRVEEVAIKAEATDGVINETHKLVNSGMTEIKERLVEALLQRDELQIALATAREKLTQGGEIEPDASSGPH